MLAFKTIAAIVLDVVLWAIMLFVPAGTLYWPRAWILLGVIAVAVALSVRALPSDLLDQRFKLPFQQGQPLADKIVMAAFVVSFFGTIVIIPLDVFRFHLLGSPGIVVSSIGIVLFVAGWWLAGQALAENPFAIVPVRIQKERGHRLIDTGVYRLVRHPMYAAVLPMLIGITLWLGSYAAAIIAIIPFTLIAVRALLEESLLRRELPGYEDYMNRVRFRLIPFVW